MVLDNYKISKKAKMSVLRYIEKISGSVGNFVKCIGILSMGYSDIKFCSSYKNNRIHMKPTVLIRQTYIQTLCKHDWKFYLVTWIQRVAL